MTRFDIVHTYVQNKHVLSKDEKDVHTDGDFFSYIPRF